MFEMHRPFRLAFVNPMSVDNLALYDISLLLSILKDESEAVIRYYGNEDFDQQIPESVNFSGIYRYRNHGTLFKGISYLLSQIWLIGELIRFRPDIVHIQWPKLPILDRFVWRILKRKLRSTIFIHTSHNILPHDAPAVSAKFWRPIYRVDGRYHRASSRLGRYAGP